MVMAARVSIEPVAAWTFPATVSASSRGTSSLHGRLPFPVRGLVHRFPTRLRLSVESEDWRRGSLRAGQFSHGFFELKSVAEINGVQDKDQLETRKLERGKTQVAISAASSSGRKRSTTKKPRVKKGRTAVVDKGEDVPAVSINGFTKLSTDDSFNAQDERESGAKENVQSLSISSQASAPASSVDGDHLPTAEPAENSSSPVTHRNDSVTELQRAGEVQTSGKENSRDHTVEEEVDPELEKGYKMSRVCERLVEIFMVEKPEPSDWRKLIVFSSEWEQIRPYFHKKIKDLADQEEDFGKKADYLKFSRQLQEVEDDMARHNDLLAAIEKDPKGLEGLVALRRKDFTSTFFAHLKLLADACYENLGRRDEIAAIAAQCLSVLEMHDASVEDSVSLASAQAKLDHVLSAPSLDAATDRINEYARKNELDSTFMLLMSKAWAAARDTNMVKEEAQDIMYHLYMVARGNMQRLVPKEVRILKHLLSMEDPRERFSALTEAFTPGPELEGEHIDTLYTTPDALYKWIEAILNAYYSNRGGSLIKEAAQLMNPLVIKRLEMLKEQMEDQFM